jgi:hypothetical protein
VKEKFERRQILDPAVADVVGGMERQSADRKLTKKERSEKQRQRARSRLTVDLPADIESKIGALAAAHGVPISGLVMLAIARFLRDVGSGLSLTPYKRVTRSPRFDWMIELPENKDEL